MRKNTLFFTIFLILLLTVVGVVRFRFAGQASQKTEILQLPSPEPSLAPSADAELTAKAEAIITQLSPEQKIGQVIAVPASLPLAKSEQASLSAYLKSWQPGAVTIFGKNISSSSATQFVTELKQQEPTIWVMVDHEGGIVQRLNGKGFTRLPSWQSMCNLPTAVQTTIATQTAEELKKVGIDVVLGPVVDITATNSALKDRGCSDPVQIQNSAGLLVSTLSKQGIMSVLKHFPGIGQVTEDLHQDYSSDQVNESQIAIYKTLLKNSPRTAVMTAHLGVKDDSSQTPCSLSKGCIDRLLQFSPKTLVFSDALEMNSASHSAGLLPKKLDQVSLEALQAGNSVLVFGPSVDESQITGVINRLLTEYNESATFRELIHQHLLKIFKQKIQSGLLQ